MANGLRGFGTVWVFDRLPSPQLPLACPIRWLTRLPHPLKTASRAGPRPAKRVELWGVIRYHIRVTER